MKIISLNIWGGELFKPLSAFIAEHAQDTDIFCFQEVSISPEPRDKSAGVYDDLFGDISALLPEHKGYFASAQQGFNWEPVTNDVSMGNAIFIRNTMAVAKGGEVFICREKNSLLFEEALQGNWFSMPRVLQFIQTIGTDGEPLTVFNYHGLWHKDGKGDIPERLEQSRKISAFVEKFSGKKILCGDFNLDIHTKSVANLESSLNMRNLVKEFGIQTTRSPRHYPKYATMPFADYMFTSKDITVRNFNVPQSPASDHLPLIAEFN